MKSNFAYQPLYPDSEITLKKFYDPIMGTSMPDTQYPWYEQVELFDIIEVCSFDFPNFPESEKIFKVVYFKLNHSEIRMKQLFNGLIRLGQPQGVILEYHKEIDTYTLKFYVHEELDAFSYVSGLQRELEKDLRFRRVLAAVISQEELFENSQRLLMKELFN
ncbi:hypothetical protein [Cecembia rubra]|uniref:Uncharacterized protein n=1 Tax=Cecembia rubra TaxID=1485585 RepID=A0A2P8ECQ2_9BACT|nr:hypothetical protein [Cecembia rubra]PSL07231.1 hypothetical protein CLV48_101161 [Cecembia rubra]